MSQSTSAGARPKLLVACVGTATEVGKTWVGARTIEALRRRSIQVAARKPAESFAVDGHEPLDSEVLAHTSGEPAEQVTPPQRRYAVALAPPMAAQRLGLAPPLIAELLVEPRVAQRVPSGLAGDGGRGALPGGGRCRLARAVRRGRP